MINNLKLAKLITTAREHTRIKEIFASEISEFQLQRELIFPPLVIYLWVISSHLPLQIQSKAFKGAASEPSLKHVRRPRSVQRKCCVRRLSLVAASCGGYTGTSLQLHLTLRGAGSKNNARAGKIDENNTQHSFAGAVLTGKRSMPD